MKENQSRREFLKSAGLVGAGVFTAGLTGCAPRRGITAPPPRQGKSVAGLAAPKLEKVRVGMIGVGNRGTGHTSHLSRLENVEIKAICDIREDKAIQSQDRCVKAGHPRPDLYTLGDYDYRRMLEREDLDMVVISTPWRWHAPQCVDAMLAGKHAFTEVPAAVTMEECWQLVDTSEKTQKYCMMLENVCYGREELLALNMCRQGLLGELLHGEAAYIHDLRGMLFSKTAYQGMWRIKQNQKRNGNLYPTHGLGPIAQYMNINRGDRFQTLVSMSTKQAGLTEYAIEKFGSESPKAKQAYLRGDMNTSLIRTAKGRTIMVQHDVTSPRPYTRHNLIQGTNGMFGGYPNRIVVEGRGSTHRWQDLKPYYEEFDHPLWKRMGKEAEKAGGHGGMDFLMIWRFVHCLRNGEPIDQDVYDAASWSAVSPLSEYSVAHGNSAVDFPDFTRGEWKGNEPLPVVS